MIFGDFIQGNVEEFCLMKHGEVCVLFGGYETLVVCGIFQELLSPVFTKIIHLNLWVLEGKRNVAVDVCHVSVGL